MTDIGVISGYFLAVFGIALFFFFRRKRSSSGDETSSYFLGGRNLSWWVIGASLFASNIGSEHLIGLAGAGAKGDFAAGQFEILAALMLLLLGWFFVPFYMKSGVYTMPEFLEKRYNSWARGYLSWVSIIAYVLTKISVTIAAGGIVFTTLLGIGFWKGALLIVIITGLYTVIGGLTVVVYTDLLQMVVLIAGALGLTYFGLHELGGWEGLVTQTEPQSLSLWRQMNHPDFPWTGILLGAPILGVWYWCTDQFIVQRVLAAKNIDQARKGSIFGGFLKLLPPFLFVLPGVIAMALSTGDHSLVAFPSKASGGLDYDAALPALTMSVLPTGFKGLVIAGLLAALMSSLSSVFNSCSTLFTMDIYRKWRPKTSEKQLVYVGQIATVALVLLGLAWIPFMQQLKGGLFQKLQSIQAYISPPIAVVFLIGILSKRVTAKAARVTLLAGAVIGLVRLGLELGQDHLSGALLYFTEINFLHFAFFLFVICAVILLASSRPEDAKPEIEINQITWNRSTLSVGGSRLNILLSALLIVAVMVLWYVFK
ncbi:MAG: sodium:solute symporter [Bacteroidia bacterium]|nr:sodium:solute symporter [Bacteroidia bacterium]